MPVKIMAIRAQKHAENYLIAGDDVRRIQTPKPSGILSTNAGAVGARDVPARSSHVSRGVLEDSNRFRQVVAAAGRDVPRSDGAFIGSL
jgi:hypothetical protein